MYIDKMFPEFMSNNCAVKGNITYIHNKKNVLSSTSSAFQDSIIQYRIDSYN